MTEKKIILNLGCGKTRIPGSLGVDRMEIEGCVDKVHDLDVVPYPFEDNSVDEIHFYHVLEHLHDPVKKIEEIYRILKLGGVLHMRVPHFSSMGSFADITHIRPFSFYSFDCFENRSYQHFYTKSTFKILNKRIKYLGLYPNLGDYAKYVHPNRCPILLKPFVRIIDTLINISPMFFERFWCYWVGGATEVVLDLQKI